MKWTNKHNMPQPLADAIKNDSYSKGDSDISITGLIAPPRIRVLSKLHADELEQDVSDRLDVLIGQVAHGILERHNHTSLAEERFYAKIDGVKISGQCDAILTEGIIQDYKVTSVNAFTFGLKPEYEAQLNCYAYLYAQPITKLQLVYIFKDWSKGKAKLELKNNSDYPQVGWALVDVPIWGTEKTLEYLKERIKIHKDANKKLPLCTQEERWARPNTYAVMKDKTAKRSLKNHLNKKDAEEHAKRIGGKVEFRPGQNPRCDNFCSVSKWCKQYQLLKGEK